MKKKKQKIIESRHYPPELTQFLWCTTCLGVALEQSEAANDIFEDIIDCLDLPGVKESYSTTTRNFIAPPLS